MKGIRQGINIFSERIASAVLDSSNNDIKKRIRLIKSKITYQTIGFEHGEFTSLGNKHNKEYEEMKKNNIVIPIEVEFILTMDRPELCPVCYVELSDAKKQVIQNIRPSYEIPLT